MERQLGTQMAHLVITSGQNAGTTVPLQKVTCFGRGLDMEVRLDDLIVSKRHARVMSDDRGDFILEDLASSNGTFLNGAQVSTKQLQDGDEIRIGTSVFKFFKSDGEDGSATTSRTMLQIDEDSTSTSVVSAVDVTYETTSGALGTDTTIDEIASSNRRLRTVIEIFQSIGAALEEDELLQKILDNLFEVFPETGRGFIILRDPDTGRLTPRRTKTAKPSESDTEELQISGTILEYVLELKKAVVTADAMSDERFPTSQSILDFEMRSVMCAPLVYEEDVLGFILLDTQRIASNYNEEGATLLGGIANQAALTIANARLHAQLLKRERLEQDLRNARRIQNSFLPRETPKLPGYRFEHWYGTALEVGGDFYDFVEVPNDRVLVVVGDVSGKGISAALMMATMASHVRFFAGSEQDPAGLLSRLNEVALASAEDMFVTVLVMFLNWKEQTITMSNAGHCYPLVRKPDGTVERLEGGAGFPVGITADAEFPSTTFSLGNGDVLCLFSDGITESMNEDEDQFGYTRLTQTLADCDGSPGDMVKSILSAIRDHAGAAAQSDDLTLVCFGRSDDWEEEAADGDSDAEPADDDAEDIIEDLVMEDDE